MIAITNLSYFLGDRALYDGASLHIKPKMKIGLIGLNGTGKSTLLRMIDGEYQPDEGRISKSGDCTIGFLNQDLLSYQSDDSILSVAMQAFERQNILQVQMDKILYILLIFVDIYLLREQLWYQTSFIYNLKGLLFATRITMWDTSKFIVHNFWRLSIDLSTI